MEHCIRKATGADLAVLLALEEASFSDPWGEAALSSHLASPAGISFLSLSPAGEPCGYLLGLSLLAEGELLRVGVLPGLRGGGIGRALVEELLRTLRAAAAETCFLEVREGNTAARALYRSCGFTAVGRRKHYYKDPREDALVLSCRL